MTRISLTEQYDDRDVIAQIVRLKQGLEDASGGIITDIDIVGTSLNITWANGESVSLPLPEPLNITNVTGSFSGGYLTLTFTMQDGSTHTMTTPLTGIASENYVDTLDAQNVKLSGAQTVADTKTFTDSPIVPTNPATGGAVNDIYVNDDTGTYPNNIVHKSGNETVNGVKTIAGLLVSPLERYVLSVSSSGAMPFIKLFECVPTQRLTINYEFDGLYTKMETYITIGTGNTAQGNTVVTSHEDLTGVDIQTFMLYNAVTGKCEVWHKVSGRFWFFPRFVNAGANDSFTISSLTVDGTVQATDPSLNTTTYPNGKNSLTIKLRDLSK